MSDLMLQTAARAQVATSDFAAFMHALIERLRDDERGQDMVEYGGVILVIAAIIAALVGSNIPQTIITGITHAIQKVIP